MTSLDRLLIQAILDAAQGVSGALSRDEVDRAVEEFVRLNGRRALSYYHAGFRDTVFGESPAPEGPALDRDGKRFYWAGAIQGWARTDRGRALFESTTAEMWSGTWGTVRTLRPPKPSSPRSGR